jgi:hemerythrin-like domain-containing protein
VNTENFVQEHAAIGASVAELRKLIEAGVAEQADSIVKAIATMSSKIVEHLASEDKTLYPVLIASGDPEVAAMGRKFQSEMGNIAGAYMEFSGAWNAGAKVAAEPDRFREQATGIIKALQERIQREHAELYPAAQRS